MFKGLLFLGVLVALTGCEKPVEELGRNLGCIAKGTDCGARGRDGSDGANGLDGRVGNDGVPGPAGSSCSVQSIASGGAAPNGGARITCTDGSDALLLNGTNGIDGSDAPTTPHTIVNVIKPCPTVSGANPEVLLVLANRTLLASVSQSAGANTRLALVTPGNYTTTDGRSCAFTVTAGAVSWAGGSVEY